MAETEAELAGRVVRMLLDTGNCVLRVCDKGEAMRRQYGLRVEGAKPSINSTGPDYLVLRTGDIPVLRTDDLDEVVPWAKHRGGPFFLELKRPGARKRSNEADQDRWIRVVAGRVM